LTFSPRHAATRTGAGAHPAESSIGDDWPRPRRAALSHLASSGVAVLIVNEHGRYVHANAAAARLTGYTRNELTGLSVWDLTPSANQTDGRRRWVLFVESGRQDGQYALRHKHGHIVSAQFVALAHVLPGVHVSLLVARAPLGAIEGAVAEPLTTSNSQQEGRRGALERTT